MNFVSNLQISEDLPADVKDINNVTLWDNCFKVKSSSSGKFIMYFNTRSTSHVSVYLGIGGLELKTPVISCFIRIVCPTLLPSCSG